MDALPRDLQLNIIKRFDIDIRIKIGMIRKLQVPPNVIEKISKVCAPPETARMNDGSPIFIEKN